jgi:uncharacterized protein (TIGR04141 family)
MEAVYSEMGMAFPSDKQKELGLEPILNQDGSVSIQEVNVSFGAMVRIHKQMTFREMNNVLKTIHKLYTDTTNNNFVVNFLVPVDKKGIKQSDVTSDFLDYLDTSKQSVEFAYNHDLDKQMGEYRLFNSQNNPVPDSDIQNAGLTSLSNLAELGLYVNNRIRSGQSANTILKCRKIKRNTPSEDLNSEYKLFALVEAEHLYNGKTLYLMDGVWYEFIKDYLSFLDDAYHELYDRSQSECAPVFSKTQLNIDVKQCETENELKSIINSSPKLLDSDCVLVDNVEIADGIYLVNDSIVFLHNKTKFTGAGVRDVTGQISTSAKTISEIRNKNYSTQDKMKQYVDNLKKKNPTLHSMVDDFASRIDDANTNIVYYAVFTDDVKRDTSSNYIKYLLDTTRHHLEALQYSLFFY